MAYYTTHGHALGATLDGNKLTPRQAGLDRLHLYYGLSSPFEYGHPGAFSLDDFVSGRHGLQRTVTDIFGEVVNSLIAAIFQRHLFGVQKVLDALFVGVAICCHVTFLWRGLFSPVIITVLEFTPVAPGCQEVISLARAHLPQEH